MKRRGGRTGRGVSDPNHTAGTDRAIKSVQDRKWRRSKVRERRGRGAGGAVHHGKCRTIVFVNRYCAACEDDQFVVCVNVTVNHGGKSKMDFMNAQIIQGSSFSVKEKQIDNDVNG